MDIKIADVTLLDGSLTNLYISNGVFVPADECNPVEVIDGTKLLALPPLYNMHSHAAMTLFRGYGDDLKLMDWLENWIWPVEAHLDEETVYHAARIACLEMIRTGTIFFMDMYWHLPGTFRAVTEMGLRANLGFPLLDNFSAKSRDEVKKQCLELIHEYTQKSEMVDIGIAPHSIYTASRELLSWCAEVANEYNLKIHIHLAETQFEFDQCMEKHGCTPVEYLDEIGLLSDRVWAAHGIYLTDSDIETLAQRQVKVVSNPVSNLKLTSGICPVDKLLKAGVEVVIGTDGVASNNNLDMFEEMKFLALLQKHTTTDPTVLPATTALAMATTAAANSYHNFAQPSSTAFKYGAAADLILIDLKNVIAQPIHCLKSHLVYAANGSVVDSVICAGELLMKSRKIPNEAQIIAEAEAIFRPFFKKTK